MGERAPRDSQRVQPSDHQSRAAQALSRREASAGAGLQGKQTVVGDYVLLCWARSLADRVFGKQRQ